MKTFDTYEIIPAYHNFQIVRHSDGQVVERHYSLQRAQDAAWMLNTLQYDNSLISRALDGNLVWSIILAACTIGVATFACAFFAILCGM